MWSPELPVLAVRPLKLPIACFLASSVNLCHLSGWKLSHVHDTRLFYPENAPLLVFEILTMPLVKNTCVLRKRWDQ